MNLAAQQQYLESDADYSGTGCVRPPGFGYGFRGDSCRAIPSEQFGEASPLICRESSGYCDFREFCKGDSISCPANAIKPAGALCMACEKEVEYDGETLLSECDAFNGNGRIAVAFSRLDPTDPTIPDDEVCGPLYHPCRCAMCDGESGDCLAQYNFENVAEDDDIFDSMGSQFCERQDFINGNSTIRSIQVDLCVTDITDTYSFYSRNNLVDHVPNSTQNQETCLNFFLGSPASTLSMGPIAFVLAILVIFTSLLQ
jgi:hypothetical protein